jgi:hypothetical protein
MGGDTVMDDRVTLAIRFPEPEPGDGVGRSEAANADPRRGERRRAVTPPMRRHPAIVDCAVAKARTTGTRRPPTAPEHRPLVESNGALAVQVIESQLTKIAGLDPSDLDAIRDAQRFLHGDVKRVFGAESEEYTQVWQNDIISDSILLGTLGGNDEYDEYDGGSWNRVDKLVKTKADIDRMVARLRRLVDRARELAAIHDSIKGKAMGLDDLIEKMGTPFTLVKHGSGDRASYKGVRDTARGTLQVHDPHFTAESGDTIEFHPPNGKVETWDVVTSSHVSADFAPELAHYIVKLRHASTRAQLAPPQVVHHDNSTNYNIQGSTVGAVGKNATVASSHVTGHAMQWNGLDPKAIVGELKTLRRELAAAADGDGADADQSEADLDHVNAANKALAANDEGGFMSAMKKLSAFGLKIVERVATAATIAYLQAHGVLPPTPHHGALPPGE